MKKFKGKVAMVSGAAQGIGKGIALEYAKNGADLAILDLNGERLAETAKEVEALGVKCITSVGNVADEEIVINFVNKTIEELGSIDVLAHAAGILKSCAVIDQDVKDWDAVIAVNLRSTFLFGKYAGRQMKKTGQRRDGADRLLCFQDRRGLQCSILCIQSRCKTAGTVHGA